MAPRNWHNLTFGELSLGKLEKGLLEIRVEISRFRISGLRGDGKDAFFVLLFIKRIFTGAKNVNFFY